MTTEADTPFSSHAEQRASLSSKDLSVDYSQWRERLRKKTNDAKRVIDLRDNPSDDARPLSNYWSPDALFQHGQGSSGGGELLNYAETQERAQAFLEVLGLEAGATAGAIHARYLELAEQHHPDRFALADGATRTFHAEKMRALITAYNGLRTLGLA